MNTKVGNVHFQSWMVLVPVAAVLVMLGLLQGDFQGVLNKAIRICFECIGIG